MPNTKRLFHSPRLIVKPSAKDDLRSPRIAPYVEHWVISMLPVGVASMAFAKDRKSDSDFVYLDAFGKK